MSKNQVGPETSASPSQQQLSPPTAFAEDADLEAGNVRPVSRNSTTNNTNSNNTNNNSSSTDDPTAAAAADADTSANGSPKKPEQKESKFSLFSTGSKTDDTVSPYLQKRQGLTPWEFDLTLSAFPDVGLFNEYLEMGKEWKYGYLRGEN